MFVLRCIIFIPIGLVGFALCGLAVWGWFRLMGYFMYLMAENMYNGPRKMTFHTGSKTRNPLFEHSALLPPKQPMEKGKTDENK